MTDTAHQIARRCLKPLFARPVSPEQRAACDAVAAEIERLQRRVDILERRSANLYARLERTLPAKYWEL